MLLAYGVVSLYMVRAQSISCVNRKRAMSELTKVELARRNHLDASGDCTCHGEEGQKDAHRRATSSCIAWAGSRVGVSSSTGGNVRVCVENVGVAGGGMCVLVVE